MVRNPFTVLGAATIVAALGLSVCSTDVESKSAQNPVLPSAAASAVAPLAASAPRLVVGALFGAASGYALHAFGIKVTP